MKSDSGLCRQWLDRNVQVLVAKQERRFRDLRCSRLIPIIGFFAAAGYAHADRLISIPIGNKIRYRFVRAEFRMLNEHRERYIAALGMGVTRDLEVEVFMDRLGGRARGTFDVAFSQLPPIVDTSPGISIGVRDVLNRTADGRYSYLAFTNRIGLDGEFNGGTPMELTLGARFGKTSGAFVGVMLPFTWQFRLLAEHDAKRAAAGLEYLPFHGWSVRLMTDERGPSCAVRYIARF